MVTRSSRERRGAADLDLALAARAADDDAAERRVEGQLLDDLHVVAGAVERALRRGHAACRAGGAMLGLARPVRWSVRSPSRPSEVRPKLRRQPAMRLLTTVVLPAFFTRPITARLRCGASSTSW